MSGGSYDYAYGKINSIIEDIDEHIQSGIEYKKENPEYEGSYKTIGKEVKELKKLLHAVSAILRELEWCTSGDTCPEDFLAAYKKFKRKLKESLCDVSTLKSLMTPKRAKLAQFH